MAATATVRRAAQQIQALYGREDTAIFPPPGVDANETYFAEVDKETPGRRYLGVAAPGRAMKFRQPSFSQALFFLEQSQPFADHLACRRASEFDPAER